jgi:hypothetical protein
MLGRYSKAIATALGSTLTIIITDYPNAHWLPIVTGVLTVLATFAITNTPKEVGKDGS